MCIALATTCCAAALVVCGRVVGASRVRLRKAATVVALHRSLVLQLRQLLLLLPLSNVR